MSFFFAFIYAGCGFYAFSLFVIPLEQDLGWDRASIMLGLTLSFLTTGIAGPFVGRFVDRYAPKTVMAAGALVGAIGFIFTGLATELWHFYGSFVINGLSMAGIGPIPTTYLISNWFKKRRGTAIGITSAGIGAGGLVLSPLIGGFVIPNLGWRLGYIALALFVALLIPLALLIIKTRPSDIGLLPDGNQPVEKSETRISPAISDGMTFRTAISTSAFWLLIVSFFTFSIAEVGVLQNEVPYLQGVGFSAAAAASIHGLIGLFSTIGKFLFGWLCDKIKASFACAIGTALQIIGTLLLMKIDSNSSPVLIAFYVLLVGLGVGNWLPTMSMLVSTNFGLLAYGAIFGSVAFSQSLGGAAAPFFSGYIYDILGSYQPILIVLAISYGISLISVLFVVKPKNL